MYLVSDLKANKMEGGPPHMLQNTSIPKITAGLMLFYLAILGNYTGNIIPRDLSKFIN